MENEELEYHRKYYKENKQRISDLRKIKYYTNRTHREKLISRAKKYYRDKLKPKDPDRKMGYSVKIVDGVALYSMRYALAIIKRSRDFYIEWEGAGRIPRSTYTDARGWRLFTEHQITLLSTAFEKYDTKEWNREQVRSFLFTYWK